MHTLALRLDGDGIEGARLRGRQRSAPRRVVAANDNLTTTATTTTHYHYGQAGELLGESDGAGVVTREYVWLGGLPVAQVDGATGEVFFIHADHLGSPQAVTDALGQLAWEDVYQPFGTATNTGAATAVSMDLRFPGQRTEAETGYAYNYFRDYDPTLGRYLQSDPIGLRGGLNTYAYVGGNPVGAIDPYGLWSTEAHNQMIDSAFIGVLSNRDVSSLKAGSKYADSFANQGGDKTYMHSMRSPGQSVAGAIRRRDTHINGILRQAREELQKDSCFGEPDREQAMFQLGVALHAIMDSYSPAHVGANGNPKVWGNHPLEVITQGHSPVDHVGVETSKDLTPQILNDSSQQMLGAFRTLQ